MLLCIYRATKGVYPKVWEQKGGEVGWYGEGIKKTYNFLGNSCIQLLLKTKNINDFNSFNNKNHYVCTSKHLFILNLNKVKRGGTLC